MLAHPKETGMNGKDILINVTKKVYRALLPTSVRDSSMVAKIKARLLGHDWIYNSDYYDMIFEGPVDRSARRIADSIINDFMPTSVIDVGCGTGILLEELRHRGCEVFGLEYAEAALRYCRTRRLHVTKFNLENNVFDDVHTFDVAISMEVAEHLPDKAANHYVDLLTRLSRVVVFTAASPGQGGANHVNEQPPSYWIAKFQQSNFKYDEELSQRWRESWKAAGDVQSWYHKNLLIFRQVRAI